MNSTKCQILHTAIMPITKQNKRNISLAIKLNSSRLAMQSLEQIRQSDFEAHSKSKLQTSLNPFFNLSTSLFFSFKIGQSLAQSPVELLL